MFITFEGIDGSGKSTQIEKLRVKFEDMGYPTVITREPGGTDFGEKVRALMFSYTKGDISPRSEVFLFNAARAQLIDNVIRPALREGKIVLCDRFADSTVAYQCYGRGMPQSPVAAVNSFALNGITPDLTFLLDIYPQVALNRKTGQTLNYMDTEALTFHERVREGYKRIAKMAPWQWVEINAQFDIEFVHSLILDAALDAIKEAA